MKRATFPSLRVAPEFRQAAKQEPEEGETLSSFVEESIRENIARRQLRSEFVARGLASHEQAREPKEAMSARTHHSVGWKKCWQTQKPEKPRSGQSAVHRVCYAWFFGLVAVQNLSLAPLIQLSRA